MMNTLLVVLAASGLAAGVPAVPAQVRSADALPVKLVTPGAKNAVGSCSIQVRPGYKVSKATAKSLNSAKCTQLFEGETAAAASAGGSSTGGVIAGVAAGVAGGAAGGAIAGTIVKNGSSNG